MARVLLHVILNLALAGVSMLFMMRYGACVVLPPAALACGLIAYLMPQPETLWQQRASRGLCTKCGYDLRASIIRCPECGHSMED